MGASGAWRQRFAPDATSPRGSVFDADVQEQRKIRGELIELLGRVSR